VSAIANSAR